MKKTKESGITLIALVVTIIVLLILAGISIAMLTGSNGIITKANESDYETVRGEAQERINLALDGAFTDLLTEKYVKSAEASLDEAEIIKENGLGEDAAILHGTYKVKINKGAQSGKDVVYIYWEPKAGYGEPMDGAIVANSAPGELAYKIAPASSKVAATSSPGVE